MLNIGVRSQSTIVPISGYTKRTKHVPLTVTGSGYTPYKELGVAYCDSDNNWRLVFNIGGAESATSSSLITIDGVVFEGTRDQGISCSCSGVDRARGAALALAGTANIQVMGDAGAVLGNIRLSEDVALASEPTWAAANLEGVANVAAFFPNASTTPGLLDYYAEGSFTVYGLDSGTAIGSPVTCYYVRVGKQVTVTIYGGDVQSTSTSRYLSTTAGAGNVVGNRTWPAVITPSRVAYPTLRVRTGTATFVMAMGGINPTGDFILYADPNGGAFSGNNEYKGGCECTFSYNLN